MNGTILDKIIADKAERVKKAMTVTTIDDLLAAAEIKRSDRKAFCFKDAVSQPGVANIIAEFKRASPSKGVINGNADAAKVAKEYEINGAAAVSVLTEQDHFKGSGDDLKAVRNAVSLPILRKDFVVDAFQIYEAAAIGADAILLIVAALKPEKLAALQDLARSLGLDALVEVHDAEEMNIAKDIGAEMIGVNNRDLRTFEVSLDVSRRLIASKPENTVMITESGISTIDEINELKALGFSGFLIGETLMRGGLALLNNR